MGVLPSNAVNRYLPPQLFPWYFRRVSTLSEIEAAVQLLPRRQQDALLRNLAKRLIGPSCYDLARDLFEKPGKLGAGGKRDISTNKAHLAGFGRSAGKRTK